MEIRFKCRAPLSSSHIKRLKQGEQKVSGHQSPPIATWLAGNILNC